MYGLHSRGKCYFSYEKKYICMSMLEERTDLSYKEDLRERERGKKYEENL